MRLNGVKHQIWATISPSVQTASKTSIFRHENDKKAFEIRYIWCQSRVVDLAKQSKNLSGKLINTLDHVKTLIKIAANLEWVARWIILFDGFCLKLHWVPLAKHSCPLPLERTDIVTLSSCCWERPAALSKRAIHSPPLAPQLFRRLSRRLRIPQHRQTSLNNQISIKNIN